MNALRLNRADLAVVLVPTEVDARDKALARAREVTAVEDAMDLELCGASMKELQGMIKAVEASRTEVKSPVLDLGRKIDGLAKEFANPIEAELGRLKGLFSKYQAEQIRLAQEAEAKRQAEARKAEAEAKARAEAQRQAEADFLGEEAKPVPAPEPPKAVPAGELPLLAPPKPKAMPTPSGISARPIWTFEVTDIHALYQAHPEWVQLEPRRAEINKALADGMRECPGLAIRQETKTTVRA